MLVYQPRSIDTVYVTLRGDSSDIGVVPTHDNMSTGEKDVIKNIKYFIKSSEDYDPFMGELIDNRRLILKFSNNSSSFFFNKFQEFETDKLIKISSIQNKRNKFLQKYPYRFTLKFDKKYMKILRKYLKDNFVQDDFFIMLLNKITDETSMYDVYFLTEDIFNKFIKEYMLGVVSPPIDDYDYSNTVIEFSLDNGTRYPILGKNLQYLVPEWENIYFLSEKNCREIACNIQDNFLQFYNNIGSNTYEECYFYKIKEIHDWAKENLEKRFLVMGIAHSQWIFESEDDMNFFIMKWCFNT